MSHLFSELVFFKRLAESGVYAETFLIKTRRIKVPPWPFIYLSFKASETLTYFSSVACGLLIWLAKAYGRHCQEAFESMYPFSKQFSGKTSQMVLYNKPSSSSVSSWTVAMKHLCLGASPKLAAAPSLISTKTKSLKIYESSAIVLF